MHRLVVLFALFISLIPLPVMAQVVGVGKHFGVADPANRRVLVTLTDDDFAGNGVPETITLSGKEFAVQKTTLPIVQLQHDTVSRDDFTPGNLFIIDPNAMSGRILNNYSAEFRHRGATASLYDKKSYAVKLVSLDASLLGMRSDNSWILDAMASDCSRMRNRVSTDLWLDFSRCPYYADDEPDMVNGTHGKFVELFINDRYWGLYCLTEKPDRKQLRIKKFKDGTPRGIIYKSFDYSNFQEIKDPSPSNDSFVWQGWEGSYPDVRKDEPFDWTPLFDLYTFLRQEGGATDVVLHLHERIDIPLWRDYVLFCDLLHADDNVAKNMIVYYRDITQPATLSDANGRTETVPAPGPLCICPWDLDATWGRDYVRRLIDPASNCNVSNLINYHIWVSQPDNGMAYLKRWEELRHTYFTPEVLWKYFERYFDLFDASGAGAREIERWQDVNNVHIDFEAERDYVRHWIAQRLAFLDGEFNYKDESIDAVHADEPASSATYTLDGRLVQSKNRSKALKPGLYIEGGKKKIVR